MNTQLRTRKPTGKIPYPLVLLEGPEKAGKSYEAAKASGDERIGRTFWFDLGEGAADEYAELGRYEVVEHNGTYDDLLGQLRAAHDMPADEQGRPNIIVIDSISTLWTMLVDEQSAASRRTKRDGSPVITMNQWNLAKRKWRAVMDLLMTFPGIVVLTARGKEVVEMGENDQPTGNKNWKVEGEKTLAYDATACIRLLAPQHAELRGVRSLRLRVPEGGFLPLPNFSLASFIFDDLGCVAGETQARDYHAPTADTVPAVDVKRAIIGALGGDTDAAAAFWGEHGTDAPALARADAEALLEAAKAQAADIAGEPDADEVEEVAA